jgi:rod shape-determining protein MreC
MEPQQTAFFIRGPSPLARLTFFAALSFLLMAVDSRLHYLAEVRQGFATLLHPLEILASSPVHMYRRMGEYFADQGALTRETRQLHEQTMRLATDLQRLPALQAENDHLRRLLEARQTLQQPVRVAEIMHAGRDPFVQRIIVNVGSQQGVAAGQAVVDGMGVVGQVTHAYPFSSEITLITDRELAVPVQVERNGLRAIAFGHGRDNAMDLPYLPVNVDIREGDKLVTSGIDGTYPMGLAVAMVTHIERNNDSPFARIICTPTAGTDRHRHVLILATSPSAAVEPEEQHIAEKKKVSPHHVSRQR